MTDRRSPVPASVLAALPLPLPLLVFLAMASAAAGCNPHIGHKCETSRDCSDQGERLCDISQPEGYCTIPDCDRGAFECPNEAMCVAFRDTTLSYCLRACDRVENCRTGYVCCVPQLDADISILPLTDGSEPAGGSPGYCIAAEPGTTTPPPGCEP